MSAARDTLERPHASTPFRYKVGGMDCASCAKTIERGLAELDGVDEIRVNFTTETIEGRGNVAAEAVQRRVEALGYRIVDDVPAAGIEEPGGLAGFLRFLWREPFLRLALALGLLVLATSPLAIG